MKYFTDIGQKMTKKLKKIFERKRSPEEAAKLGEYMVKRAKRKNKNTNIIEPFPAAHKPSENNDWTKDDDYFANAYDNAHNVFKKRKKNIQDIPVKDLLKRNEQPVNFEKKYFLNHKIHDKRPINVVKSRRTGELEIIDGYHRLFTHRLLGKDTIKANVQHVGRGKLKEDAHVNHVGDGAIAGTDQDPPVSRKRQKSWQKQNEAGQGIFRRQKEQWLRKLHLPKLEEGTFAGHKTFKVPTSSILEVRMSKKKYGHWSKFLPENNIGLAIREWANANPNAPVILEDDMGNIVFVRYGKQ